MSKWERAVVAAAVVGGLLGSFFGALGAMYLFGVL